MARHISQLIDTLQQRIVILDGAMGTMVASYGLTEEDFRSETKGNNDILNLTRPDVIYDIHRRYLLAGADIITTNTFSSQRISQADYHLEDRAAEMAFAGAKIARQAIDDFQNASDSEQNNCQLSIVNCQFEALPRLVAGSVGPTNKMMSMSPDVNDPAARDITYRQLFDAYYEQMEALIEGGADLLLMETIFDTLNAKVALDAANKVICSKFKEGDRRRIMLSATIADKSGRTLSGQTVGAFLASVLPYDNLLSVGLNCSMGAHDLKPYIAEMSRLSPIYVSTHPNAGLPDEMGIYTDTPEKMSKEIAEFIDEGLVNIVGGCCGTTDQHIAAFANLAKSATKLRAVEILPEKGFKTENSDENLSGKKSINESLSEENLSSEEKIDNEPALKGSLSEEGLNNKELSGESAPNTKLASASNLIVNCQLSIVNSMALSGLDPLTLTPEVKFVNVGERCNVAGSRKFLRLIQNKQYDEALEIARKQADDGAMVIDINMDDALLDAKAEMGHFLKLIASDPEVARLPVMIDSSKWEVIMEGLENCQGKCIVNSISLKEGEEVFLSHAADIKRMGAAVVVMCFDEKGQATTYDRRIEIAERSYRLLTEKAGINPVDIIIDPNVLAIATGMEEHDNYALDFINATRWIRQNLKGAHVSGGVSNLSFSFRGNNYIREAMHAVFLYHSIQAGQDFGIVNPSAKITYNDIPQEQLEILEDVILNRRPGAVDTLISLADKIMEEKNKEKEAAKGSLQSQIEAKPQNASDSEQNNCQLSTFRLSEGKESSLSLPSVRKVDRRSTVNCQLSTSLIRGTSDHLSENLQLALSLYPHAVDIIEGPLMDGMNTVGKLFAEGKMFLPQVVKTARTMKQAVAILQPYIEAEKQDGKTTAGTVVIATVKGDVHDIGKNIVAVVMACNNFEVIDLGVMVPAQDIVKAAIEKKADMVALSGLITPSLDEMANVAAEMEKAGLRIPLLIGGATTSEMHVALKIAPHYSGIVMWMKDAANNVVAASELMTPGKQQEIKRQLDGKYMALREEYRSKQENLLSLAEARNRRFSIDN